MYVATKSRYYTNVLHVVATQTGWCCAPVDLAVDACTHIWRGKNKYTIYCGGGVFLKIVIPTLIGHILEADVVFSAYAPTATEYIFIRVAAGE